MKAIQKLILNYKGVLDLIHSQSRPVFYRKGGTLGLLCPVIPLGKAMHTRRPWHYNS